MTSRRSLLAALGATGAAGWAWVSRERWTFRDYAGPYGRSRTFWDDPVVDHCYAEGIDPGPLRRWSR